MSYQRELTDIELKEIVTIYHGAKATLEQNILFSQLCEKVQKLTEANNMGVQDVFDMLVIIAPLCNKLEPERAKNLLKKIVDVYV